MGSGGSESGTDGESERGYESTDYSSEAFSDTDSGDETTTTTTTTDTGTRTSSHYSSRPSSDTESVDATPSWSDTEDGWKTTIGAPLTLNNATHVHFAGFPVKALALLRFLQDQHPSSLFPDQVTAATDLSYPVPALSTETEEPKPGDPPKAPLQPTFAWRAGKPGLDHPPVTPNARVASLEDDAAPHFFSATLDFHHLWAWASQTDAPLSGSPQLATLALHAFTAVSGFHLRLGEAARNRVAALESSLAQPQMEDGRLSLRELDAEHWRRTRGDLYFVAIFYALLADRLKPILPPQALRPLQEFQDLIKKQKDEAVSALREQATRLTASLAADQSLCDTSPPTGTQLNIRHPQDKPRDSLGGWTGLVYKGTEVRAEAYAGLVEAEEGVRGALGMVQREAAMASSSYLAIWHWIASQRGPEWPPRLDRAREFFLAMETTALPSLSQYHKERFKALKDLVGVLGTASYDAHRHLLARLDTKAFSNARLHLAHISHYNTLLVHTIPPTDPTPAPPCQDSRPDSLNVSPTPTPAIISSILDDTNPSSTHIRPYRILHNQSSPIIPPVD